MITNPAFWVGRHQDGRWTAGNLDNGRAWVWGWMVLVDEAGGALEVRGNRIVEWLDLEAAVDRALDARRTAKIPGTLCLASAIHHQWTCWARGPGRLEVVR